MNNRSRKLIILQKIKKKNFHIFVTVMNEQKYSKQKILVRLNLVHVDRLKGELNEIF